jgi:hypothetical protein
MKQPPPICVHSYYLGLGVSVSNIDCSRTVGARTAPSLAFAFRAAIKGGFGATAGRMVVQGWTEPGQQSPGASGDRRWTPRVPPGSFAGGYDDYGAMQARVAWREVQFSTPEERAATGHWFAYVDSYFAEDFAGPFGAREIDEEIAKGQRRAVALVAAGRPVCRTPVRTAQFLT